MVRPEAARQQIDSRLAQLRLLSRADLAALPSTSVEAVSFGPDEWSLTTYVEPEKSGSIRVVVQIGPSQPKLLLLHVQADGYRLAPDGSVSLLSERELLEFM